MLTVLEVIQKTTDFFTARGVESARLNAELLVGHALGLKRMALYLQFERVLSETELEAIRPLVRRRGQREPLQYILGEVEFCGLRLKVDRRALIPRPETEYLVELLTARLTKPPASILDLGTGSGALALAFARHYPDSQVTGVDLQSPALALAGENAGLNGMPDRLTWLISDWFSALPTDARYDLIVANPPYLTEEETTAAAPEVRLFEPISALASSDAGMADIKVILTQASRHLNPDGLIGLETGIAQHAELLAWGERAGLTAWESCPDLTGRDRYVFARRAG